MKSLHRLLLIAAVLGLCACGSVATKISDSILEVRTAFDKQLPADFSGPVKLSYINAYYVINIDAEGVRKGSDGQWTWKSAHLKRDSHIPITPGFNWVSGWEITLGAPSTP